MRYNVPYGTVIVRHFYWDVLSLSYLFVIDHLSAFLSGMLNSASTQAEPWPGLGARSAEHLMPIQLISN